MPFSSSSSSSSLNMAKPLSPPPSLLVLLLVLLVLVTCPYAPHVRAHCNFGDNQGRHSKVKGMFVFGSSLMDNGNNNLLGKTAKANYKPYGIDFPLGLLGRFTNGRNVVDLLGEYLELPSLIPPFADPETKGPKAINGVDFASGGSGILDDTGSIVGQVTSLSQQIRNFEGVTLPDLEAQVGCPSGESLLGNHVFVVGTGSNDYTFNYFLSANRKHPLLRSFTANLISSLSLELQKLYKLGGRKFVLMAINPIGCSPMAKARLPMRVGCLQVLNQAAHLFNAELKSLVDDLNAKLPGSHFVFVNSYKIVQDIIKDPTSHGFNDTTSPCCEVASFKDGGNGVSCKRGGRVCTDRSSYVFFDGLHPTEAVNVQIATKAFTSNLTTEVYPINVKNLGEA
ncbi:GDSL esterase/lipase At4g16230-like [Rhodamnia argentea]|uniref:GDSL esterase/lipase At4g16230-like n=1 Tax=Rhodamnia argentea TaxID=178133 RepID=A0A8B8NWV5_9MYRT|nr:GDSL esterase/lipase At4g16230-like [Rhodamnia argentea]